MVGNKAQKAVAAALTGVLTLGTVAPAFATDGWVRIDGSYLTQWEQTGAPSVGTSPASSGVSGFSKVDGVDRYDTMRQAVAMNIEDGEWADATDVVLVSGTSYADALSASGLAGVLDAPLVTTPANKLGEDARMIIAHLAARAGSGKLTVHIVGGPAAVSEQVDADIRDLSTKLFNNSGSHQHVANETGSAGGDIKVTRIYGEDRTETSLEVMDEIIDYADPFGYSNSLDYGYEEPYLFVANGWAWADALSVSSYSYRYNSPILLTDSEGNLTQAQLDYIADEFAPDRVSVKVIGGPAEASLQQFEGTLKDNGFKAAAVGYIAGDDRYDTSALVAADLSYGGDIAVATGKNWPDALVGGPFIGARYGDLVLIGEQGVDKNWDAAVKQVMQNNSWLASGTNQGEDQFILGGEAAVSRAVADRLGKYYR